MLVSRGVVEGAANIPGLRAEVGVDAFARAEVGGPPAVLRFLGLVEKEDVPGMLPAGCGELDPPSPFAARNFAKS